MFAWNRVELLETSSFDYYMLVRVKLQEQGIFHLAGPRYAREKKAPSELLQPWFQMKSLTLQFEKPLDERIFRGELAQEIVEELGTLVPFYRYFAKLAAMAE